jgi:hypothetical protein
MICERMSGTRVAAFGLWMSKNGKIKSYIAIEIGIEIELSHANLRRFR